MQAEVEIAVIGAGVIGLTTALTLHDTGHEVMLIDPADAGSGASYGNAGTIADYAVMPVGTPAVLRDLPRLLLDASSPLAIRRASIAALAPWLLRFAWQSLPKAAARNAGHIAALVGDAAPRWRALASSIGAADIIQNRGALYLYDTASAFAGASTDMAQRKSLGVAVDLIGQDALHALEPNLPAAVGAAYFGKAAFLSDPAQMMAALAAAAQRRQIPHHRASISALSCDAAGIRLTDSAGQVIVAHKVVLAAGAHSRALARMAGDDVPLDTERGYHLEWDMDTPLLSRPCCPAARGFYLCPMQGRLRVAGTVELGGLTAPPSRHRLDLLQRGARHMFAHLGAPSRSWMGFRPSMPDSLPVIGAGRDGRVFHAYGHGHIGLTLAPITAAMIADIVKGIQPHQAARACSPLRF